MKATRVVIIDDEALARERVRSLLADATGVTVVAECSGGREAVETILGVRPDLVFLDVQMPDLNGFEVLEAVAAEWLPAVIFVTAYDEYAIKAFDVHAVDYLLKPIEAERFRKALARATNRGAGLLSLLDERPIESSQRILLTAVAGQGVVFEAERNRLDRSRWQARAASCGPRRACGTSHADTARAAARVARLRPRAPLGDCERGSHQGARAVVSRRVRRHSQGWHETHIERGPQPGSPSDR